MSAKTTPAAKSQRLAILSHLEKGNTLTQAQSYHQFGSFRLSARILELRMQRHDIKTTTIKVGSKYVAEYSLEGVAV
jgi:hypothetical protein